MKRVLFLHIPKTAGQSVHQFLIDKYGEENVCPARVNDQFTNLGQNELKKYTVYSGHFDWSHFDVIDENIFTFTILRDPLDRVLSFYFYLREQAMIFKGRGELESKPGLKAALENSPYEFFVEPNNIHRGFIDENIDNFYLYFFAGRKYSARAELSKMVGSGKVFRTADDLVELAFSNLKNHVDAVYSIENWKDGLSADLKNDNNSLVGESEEYTLNRGRTNRDDREKLLLDLGADDAVFERLSEICRLDYKLIDTLEITV